jgi:hypothetical protein
VGTSIALEIGLAAGAALNLNQEAVRQLGNVTTPAATISMSNFYGQSFTRGLVWNGNTAQPTSPANQYGDAQQYNIQTLGSAITWGAAPVSNFVNGRLTGNTSRLIYMNPQTGSQFNRYGTWATQGITLNFGLTNGNTNCGVFSGTTRAINMNGNSATAPWSLNCSYITIATTGNSTFFGNALGPYTNSAGFSSPTRGVNAGGYSPGTVFNTIGYVTIATTGNETLFGSLFATRGLMAGVSSPTRGVMMGGVGPASVTVYTNTIQYVTIATTGNALSFGTLLSNRGAAAGMSSPTRGIAAGGQLGPATASILSTANYITIATTGNGLAYGALLQGVAFTSGGSNCNGGQGL